MTELINKSKTALLILGAILLNYSCSKDNDESQEEVQLSQAELKTILKTDEVAASVDTILADIYLNDSSTAKEGTDCYVAEYTETGYNVTFNNCVLNGSGNINGSLSVTYAAEGSSATFSATYIDFYVGSTKLNGTRSYSFDGNEMEGSYSFSVTSTMTAVLEDDSVISESGTKSFGFTFGNDLPSSTYTIGGNWTLQVNGNTYAVSVSETLEGNLGCGYLTSGLLEVSKNGLEVSVNFGDGSCDDSATVVYPNGATEEISLED